MTTKDELATLLDKHAKWLRGEEGGARANLARANLARANLARANLARADLDGADLDGANLARANLARAYLARANLARANLARADLARANLVGTNLVGANLDGANLVGAYLDGGLVADGAPHRRAIRQDGHEFLLWGTDQGWRIRAGCRFFAMDEARAHWSATRPVSTPLGAETADILTMFEAHIARSDAT